MSLELIQQSADELSRARMPYAEVRVQAQIVDALATRIRALVEGCGGVEVDGPRSEGLRVDPLVAAGQGLLDEILPSGQHEVRFIRESLCDLKTALLVATNIPEIPWELLHDGTDFLGLRYEMGRSLRARGPESRAKNVTSQVLITRQCLIIANPTGDLPSARDEAIAVKEILTAKGIDCDYLPEQDATFENVLHHLHVRRYDIIHYSGHIHRENGSREYGFVLRDSQFFTASAIKKHVRAPTIAFLNGCNSGEVVQGLTEAFLVAGAQVVIGSLFRPLSRGAAAFAKKFYTDLLTGSSAGQSMRQARLHVSGLDNCGASWACFVMYGDPRFTLDQQSEPYPEPSPGFAVIARSSLREPRVVPLNVSFPPKRPRAKSAVPGDPSLLKMKSSALAIVGKYNGHLTGQLKKIFDERYWHRQLITIPNMAFESLRALTAATAGAYMMEFLREVLESELKLPVDFPARMALCVGVPESASALAGLKDTVQSPSCGIETVVIYGFREGAGSETSYRIDPTISSQYAEGPNDVLDFVFRELLTVIESPRVRQRLSLEIDQTLREWVQAEAMRDRAVASSANLRARLYELEQAIRVKNDLAKYLTEKIKQLEQEKRDGKPVTPIETIRESYREHEAEVRRRFYPEREDKDEADASELSSDGPSTRTSEPLAESVQEEDVTGPEEENDGLNNIRKLYKRVARLFHPDAAQADKQSPEWWSAEINRHRDDEVFLLAAEAMLAPLSTPEPDTPLVVAVCQSIDRLFDIRALTLEATRKVDLLKAEYRTLSEIQQEWSQEGVETLKRQAVAQQLEREIDGTWRRLEVLSSLGTPPDRDRDGVRPSEN